MDYKKLADDIIANIGGSNNIENVTHCMTRLRFNLRDVAKANKDALENINGVLGVVYAGGQYMVILGQNLLPVYELVVKDYNLHTTDVVNENLDVINEKQSLTLKNVSNTIICYVSASITPMLTGLVAGGMLKVFLLIWVTFIDKGFATSTSYLLLSAIADAAFLFMPIFVAWGASTKLGGTPIYAMVASAALLHSNFTTLVAGGEAINLFGLPVRALSYGTSLLPALLIALIAYYAEKFFNKIVPGIFKSVFVGLGTIFVAGSLGFLIAGPLGNIIGQYIANAFMFLNGTVGPLAVGLLAASLPWLVMAGMHLAFVPFMPQLLTNPGYDALIRPAFLLHNMAEGGSVIGAALKTKDAQKRSEFISIAIGCIVAGVTEPAIYGVNLKYKKPMYGVMSGGLAGGIVAGAMGAKAFEMGYSNIIALPIFKQTFVAAISGVVTAILVSAIVTYLLKFEIDNSTKSITEPVKEIVEDDAIVSVCDGELIPLSQVNDPAFASGAIGDGIAIKLDNDFVCAPANGELTTVFPTGHAFGLTTNEGVEILVHIGIDTVNLKGQGFDIIVNQGQKVRAGQPIIKVNRNLLYDKGYDLTTMTIITNSNNKEISLDNMGLVKVGQILNKNRG